MKDFKNSPNVIQSILKLQIAKNEIKNSDTQLPSRHSIKKAETLIEEVLKDLLLVGNKR